MKKAIVCLSVKALFVFRSVMMLSNRTARILFLPGFEGWRWNIGRMKAYVAFLKAGRQVPAYRKFLTQHIPEKILFDGCVPDLSGIHPTDKETYIKAYTIEERCLGGKIPEKGIVVDESSGSTGMPTNWVRGRAERKVNQRVLEFGMSMLLGKERKFMINAFALGPWATGVNITMAFVDSSILKSLGPDVQKIENTLLFFKDKYKYVIMGYPPFLKTLLDQALVNWNELDVTFIFGGEGISETMRDYFIAKGIRKVYGSLGASDLELNMASENDFTIALRKELESNKMLASRLIHYPGTLPMIFQYNPMDFFIESTPEGELLVTLCRPTYVAPKIRYNIHDRGHVIRMGALKKILKECGVELPKMGDFRSDLPLLLHYGRADNAVAWFGCKISPADIQEVNYRIGELTDAISSFTLQTEEDRQANKKLTLCYELCPGRDPLHFHPETLGWKIFSELRLLNQDFRESSRMIPAEQTPQVAFFAFGTGPFLGKDIRIKEKYITHLLEKNNTTDLFV
jgi:phenylacetate-CoA ligase